MERVQMSPSSRVSAVVVYKQRLLVLMRHLQHANLDNYARWPMLLKLLSWILLFIVVFVLGYVFFIHPSMTANQQAKAQQQKLLGDFRVKHHQLLVAKQQQQHMQQLKGHFAQQLQQLPKQEQIPALLTAIHQLGQKFGLTMKNMQLEAAVQQGFLLEQPILIEAQGDYHAFGHFVSEIAKLTQLVTLHDFSIEANVTQPKTATLPLLTYRLQAKTYHYLSQAAQARAGP